MNVLLDETRTQRLDLGLPWMKQLRCSPTLEALLLEEKPATVTWGDFALLGMVNLAIMARTVRGDLRGANCLLVRLIGATPDGAAEAPTVVRRADGRQNGRG